MRSISLIIFLAIINQSTVDAQVSLTAAGRASYIAIPTVTIGEHTIGRGAKIGLDWTNKKSKSRIVEFSYDRFYLSNYVIKITPQIPTDPNYQLNVLRFAYGFRKYATAPSSGLFGEVSIGGTYMFTEGYSYSADNEPSAALAISPGFGYAGRPLYIGLQIHLIANVGGFAAYPAFNLGLHLMPSAKTKSQE